MATWGFLAATGLSRPCRLLPESDDLIASNPETSALIEESRREESGLPDAVGSDFSPGIGYVDGFVAGIAVSADL